MTENEAIEVLNNFDMQVSAKADGAYQSTIGKNACRVAVDALKEIQQYRAIGTVEECREAVNKQKEMTTKSEGQGYESEDYCPVCGENLGNSTQLWVDHVNYCRNCGQRVESE